MHRSRTFLVIAAAVLAAAAGLAAEQGMWMPQQIPDLAAKLRTLGFTGDPKAFADLGILSARDWLRDNLTRALAHLSE